MKDNQEKAGMFLPFFIFYFLILHFLMIHFPILILIVMMFLQSVFLTCDISFKQLQD